MKQGWEIKKLGEVCTIKGRIGFRGYTREDLVAQGEGAITLSPSNIIDDVLSFDKCQYISWFKYEESPEIQIFNGDIIYAKTASIGKVALVKDLPEKATINPQFVVFKDIKCNSSYLYYVVRGENFKHQISLITNGVAIPTVSQNNMANLLIPVPPLTEQEKIVAELDCLSGIIEKKKQQLKEYDALAQSIFYEMFGNPIDNEKGWEVKVLGETCLLKAGKSIKANELSPNFTSGLYPCFGGNGIRGYIAKVSHKDSYPIIGRQGALCGNVVLSAKEFYATEHAVVVQPLMDMNVVWLYYTLQFMNLNRLAQGVAQPGLSVNRIMQEYIPLPPIALQQEFASKIEAIEKQKELIKQSIAETETLFNSRMDYYFN